MKAHDNRDSIYEFDRNFRHAVYFLIDKISKEIDLYKVYIPDSLLTSNTANTNIVVIPKGAPKRRLIYTDIKIKELALEASALYETKLSPVTIFQSEFEMPKMYIKPELISAIKENGIEVFSCEDGKLPQPFSN